MPSGVGLPEALRLHANVEICTTLCGSTCPSADGRGKCPHAQITERMFSHGRWTKAPDRLPHEEAHCRGVREGGHFLYLMSKCRELPDANPLLTGCTGLRNLPLYGSLPAPGELISPWDAFVLGKMKPLRKKLQAQKAAAKADAPSSSARKRPRPMTAEADPDDGDDFDIDLSVEELLDRLDQDDASISPASTPETVPMQVPTTPVKGPLGSESLTEGEGQEEWLDFLSSEYRSLGQDHGSLGTAEETSYRSLGAERTSAPYRSLGPDASPMSIVEVPAASAAECRRACWKRLILAYGTEQSQEEDEEESESEEELS